MNAENHEILPKILYFSTLYNIQYLLLLELYKWSHSSQHMSQNQPAVCVKDRVTKTTHLLDLTEGASHRLIY